MRRSSVVVAAALLSVAVALDQLTKVWVRATLHVGESMHIGGPLYFTHVENRGAVFGLGQGYYLIPTIATVLILAAIPLIVRHLHIHYGYALTRFEAACVGLIVGGAIGNLIDRTTRSAVTDFIDVVLWPGFRWPAFNVADACAVAGTILLLIVFFRYGAREGEHTANP